MICLICGFQFKRVRFHYSIDAYGRQNDYIRYPNKLETLQEDVFWKLDNTAPQVEVTTATTIMALNIGYIRICQMESTTGI